MTPEQLRHIVQGLPEATEIETWGHPTFRVREKMFAAMSTAGDEASVKAFPEEQDALVSADPETFAVAPYVGRYGWVSVRLDRVDAEQMRGLLVAAWRRTASKRTVTAYDAVQ